MKNLLVALRNGELLIEMIPPILVALMLSLRSYGFFSFRIVNRAKLINPFVLLLGHNSTLALDFDFYDRRKE